MTYASQNKNHMKSCEKGGFRSLFKLSNKTTPQFQYYCSRHWMTELGITCCHTSGHHNDHFLTSHKKIKDGLPAVMHKY